MSEMKSPLASLVLVMVCLSITGTLVAGVYWYAVDLPQQKTTVPVNIGLDDAHRQCMANCKVQHCISYIFGESPGCDATYDTCLAECF